MNSIKEELKKLSDPKYAEFQAKLTPTVPKEYFIGVRVPELRKYASKVIASGDYQKFLAELPHEYYDENLLHSILLETSKDYNKCLKDVETFLPYIDNWAVCDTLRPKIFSKHKNELLPVIIKWMSSKDTYTCRFGVDMLMTHYLDKDFKKEYLEYPSKIVSSEYYVNMMIAWFYATALAKQWESTIPYIENHVLPDWVHAKTIQKAVESRRLTDKQKEYLRSLKQQNDM